MIDLGRMAHWLHFMNTVSMKSGRPTYAGGSLTKRQWKRILLAGLAGLAVAATSLQTADAVDATSTRQVIASADAYVDEASPTTARGATYHMLSSGPLNRTRSYVKFPVGSLPTGTTVKSAKLKVWSAKASASTTVNVSKSNDWTEQALTYANQPWWQATTIASTSGAAAQTWIELDVTSAVQQGGIVSLVLVTKDGSAVFGTRETSHDPTLTLTLASSSTTAAKPTTTTAKPTTTTAPPTAAWSSRGIPLNGQVLFGAAVGGNSDPTTLESQVGGKLGIRRTYYRADQVSSAVSTSKSDLAAGRLPWISFKAPYSWADMAAGNGDAWAKDVANQLSGVGGPVWVAIHHEPEGEDQDMKQWVAMQRRLSPIFRAEPNIAYSIIIMGYPNFFGNVNPAYTLDAMWPGDGLVDIIGMDPYNWYGTVKDGKTNTKMDELKIYYDKIAPFAKAHNTKWAVAETGYTQQAALANPGWLAHAYDDMKASGGIGLAYFDSQLNSEASWTWRLDTTEKISAYKAVLARSDRLP
jgi:hypothetical protein